MSTHYIRLYRSKQPGKCKVCEQPAYWRLGRKPWWRPIHPECYGLYPINQDPAVAAEAEANAIYTLHETLGVSLIRPERAAPTTYDMGPCTKCGASTHRYGPGGRAFCNACRGDSTVPVAPIPFDPGGPCAWCGQPGIGITADRYAHCRVHLWPPYRWPPREESERAPPLPSTGLPAQGARRPARLQGPLVSTNHRDPSPRAQCLVA